MLWRREMEQLSYYSDCFPPTNGCNLEIARIRSNLLKSFFDLDLLGQEALTSLSMEGSQDPIMSSLMAHYLSRTAAARRDSGVQERERMLEGRHFIARSEKIPRRGDAKREGVPWRYKAYGWTICQAQRVSSGEGQATLQLLPLNSTFCSREIGGVNL